MDTSEASSTPDVIVHSFLHRCCHRPQLFSTLLSLSTTFFVVIATTEGHSVVLHGCTVGDEAFVGMGAVLLDGVVVEKHGMVAAGALVWGGNPAKFLRKLTEEEVAFISQSATNYTNLAQVHAVENAKPSDEIEFEKVLRKKFAHRDEEYDSMLGVVREVPPELILPDSVLPDKSPKPSN
ncbi:hypothetical protein GW17_00054499 [Ensete ventricosum]|nr:hypothetical protein GW17_00054499 [Ensete ventricosum]RZS17423.1 hypothetical protein BHM03_00049559 [Ensete ventricosum]